MVSVQTAPAGSAGIKADIVVGVDGSEESFLALHWALKEAALSGQRVNAVFATAGSPVFSATDDATRDAEHRLEREITARMKGWTDLGDTPGGRPPSLAVTSVRASGKQALLSIGDRADQIVVGRRSLGQVTRWLTRSVSSSIVEAASVPVTVVRLRDDDEDDVCESIARALTSGTGSAQADRSPTGALHSVDTMVVGVDGSRDSANALRFAVHAAELHHATLHVLFCWQLQDLGTITGYENAIAPISVGQLHAEDILRTMVAQLKGSHEAAPFCHAFHIPASKGLITASRYVDRIIVGSRGLSGLNARMLGSVSRQIVNFAECTVTVVH